MLPISRESKVLNVFLEKEAQIIEQIWKEYQEENEEETEEKKQHE